MEIFAGVGGVVGERDEQIVLPQGHLALAARANRPARDEEGGGHDVEAPALLAGQSLESLSGIPQRGSA